ncbi:MAG: hypothetical protein GXO58_10070, partial [Thermodesulfobacteria bacterium]|nr:hypothetical protein [Thermodesulfobacteriota bacterium]
MSNEGEVFAPMDTGKGYVDWRKVENGHEPEISPGVPKGSIKTFFFPQPEPLFEFNARPKAPDAFILKEPHCPGQQRILFGVRPCDARSVALNSLPYEEDPYFQKRKQNVVIIGYLCTEPCTTCFCEETGGSPLGTEQMDVSVLDMGSSLYVSAHSDKGEKLLVSDLFRAPTEEESEKAKGLLGNGQTNQSDETAQRLRQKELMALYDAPFWQEVADSCINCGTCTFLCPTCYCFDIQDETLRGKGRRIRYWDSCMFPLFTQHASGHNPRGDKIKRVRNRFMHK